MQILNSSPIYSGFVQISYYVHLENSSRLLSVDLFVETSSLCKAPKKKCQNHINWERLRRAEIDMERVRDLMDLEDLYEEERTIRQGMASRAGVLGLMLHSTIGRQRVILPGDLRALNA